ncbi:MAG: DNA-directed RNA polymerase subunit alpha C-terminal domain-containing protein [Desulfofustis sp.]|jgi:hypothetical protein|nr:DNA-directed RNA polymerase subunit alpha C-terminal domain-containing protein [Desulfofustis sp.]
MSVLQVSDWLKDRQITFDDTKELVLLAKERDIFCFGDITVNSLTKFYSLQTRDSFYRLLRILGFYGVIFSGKLAVYSGPQEKYPEVLCVDNTHWQNKIPLLGINASLSLPLRSCSIYKMKQLHGVPVQSVIALCGKPLSYETIATSFPVKIVPVYNGFFTLKNKPLLSIKNSSLVNGETTYDTEHLVSIVTVTKEVNTAEKFLDQRLSESIETLQLSIRPLKCLQKNNINFVGELAAINDTFLLNIKNLDNKSIQEIKTRLWSVGLCTGLNVEKIPNHRACQNKENDTIPLSVDTLNLSIRSSNCLRKANIRLVSDRSFGDRRVQRSASPCAATI